MDGKIIAQSRPNGSTVRNNDSVTITIGRLIETDNEPTTGDDEENNNNDNGNDSGNDNSSTQGE